MATCLKALLYIALAISITSLSIRATDAAVGSVTEQTGPTEIVRKSKSLPSAVNSPVEMQDTIVTARARALLTFEDKTTVKITEPSRLLIDDFVYDPNKGTGKLALKVALGTARYASGQIAKNNPQQVSVKTPTATVAVRGTDFSMTVDELGRSLVMLLPSCDENGCVTGAIQVSNEAGSVFMDVAYQATLVTAINVPPTAPQVINIDQANINNLLIVSPPAIKNEQEERATAARSALDINFLNVDLLKYDELDRDHLKDFRKLDLNFLDDDLLVNVLDATSAQLLNNQALLSETGRLLPGYSEASGLKYYFNDDQSRISLSKSAQHRATVTFPTDQDSVLNIDQDSVPLTQRINSGGTTVVNIFQRN